MLNTTISTSLSQKREETLAEYLANNLTDYNDPGLLFGWNRDVVDMFTDKANRVPRRIVRPYWFVLSGDGRTNSEGFKRDIFDQLKRIEGGCSFGDILVSCKTVVEYSRVLRELDGMETHPFMQRVMADVLQTNPGVSCLAKLAVIRDRTIPQEDPIGPATVYSTIIRLFN